MGGPARSLETWEGTLLQAFLKGSLPRGSALATLWERGHSSESPMCWDMVVSGRLETPQWRSGGPGWFSQWSMALSILGL